MGFWRSTGRPAATPHVVWMTRAAKLAGIVADVRARRACEQAIVLVTHFADTLSELTEHLDREQIEWEPWAASPPEADVCAGPPGRAAVHVLPSDLMAADAPAAGATVRAGTASIIVAEMHCSEDRCARVARLAAALPFKTDLRQHLDLSEPFVRAFFDGAAQGVLSALGMKEHDSISHTMLDRAIERARQKVLRAALSDHPAETAEEWLRLNCPDLDRRLRSAV